MSRATWRQCRNYRDIRTLYQATLERNPDAWLAHLNLGNLLLEQGRRAEALAHYRMAERLEPDYPSIHFNLARTAMEEGNATEAIAEFRAALRLKPDDPAVRENLDQALRLKAAEASPGPAPASR